MRARSLLLLALAVPLGAEPVWKGPARLEFGASAQVELREAEEPVP